MPDHIVDDSNVIQETDVDEKLRHFEKMIDKNDPEQVKMLEEMKKHTSMLHHVRGDWNKPNTFRHWNETSAANAVKRIPMESETYKKYKEHMMLENTPLLEIAVGREDDHEDVSKPRQCPFPDTLVNNVRGSDEAIHP